MTSDEVPDDEAIVRAPRLRVLKLPITERLVPKLRLETQSLEAPLRIAPQKALYRAPRSGASDDPVPKGDLGNQELPLRRAQLQKLRVGLVCGRVPSGLALGAVVAWVLAGSAAFDAADDDTRFLEGLRERRLFRLAETFCRQRLADQHLSPVGRTTWTTELIRCCAGQALHAAPEARDPWWRAARETAAEFLRQQPPPPRSELVRAQDALTLVTRGELLRQEA